MAARQCDHSVFARTPVCPIKKRETQKQQPPWSPSALTTLLVIGMTFENILTEGEEPKQSVGGFCLRLSFSWKGEGENNADRSPQNM